MRDDAIRDIVSGVVRERLGTNHIADVEAMWDEDQEGDDVIDIIVTLESVDHEFDAGKLSSLCHHVIYELSRQDKTALPLITFMSKEERGEDIACG